MNSQEWILPKNTKPERRTVVCLLCAFFDPEYNGTDPGGNRELKTHERYGFLDNPIYPGKPDRYIWLDRQNNRIEDYAYVIGWKKMILTEESMPDIDEAEFLRAEMKACSGRNGFGVKIEWRKSIPLSGNLEKMNI